MSYRKVLLGIAALAMASLTSVAAYAAPLIVMPQQTLVSAGGTGGLGLDYGPIPVAYAGAPFHGRLTVTLEGDVNDIASNPLFGTTTGRGESVDFDIEGLVQVRVGRFSIDDPGFSVTQTGYKLVKSFTITKPILALILGDGVVNFAFNQSSSIGAGSTVDASISAVPEPATFAIVGLGACALFGAARRRNRN